MTITDTVSWHGQYKLCSYRLLNLPISLLLHGSSVRLWFCWLLYLGCEGVLVCMEEGRGERELFDAVLFYPWVVYGKRRIKSSTIFFFDIPSMMFQLFIEVNYLYFWLQTPDTLLIVRLLLWCSWLTFHICWLKSDFSQLVVVLTLVVGN